MSRSYHVTEKKANEAFVQGDTEPAYLVSEKGWVKKKVKAARTSGQGSVNNRAIVVREKQRTSTVRRKRAE